MAKKGATIIDRPGPEAVAESGRLSARTAQPVVDLSDSKELLEYQRQTRRFVELYRTPPVRTLASCPRCGRVVEAVFEKPAEQVILKTTCPQCGDLREVHHDRIWTKPPPDVPGSATCTLSGVRVDPVIRRLPRTVRTLCPQCGAIVLGRYFVRSGQVLIEKTCPEHGYFQDRISSDVRLYCKAAWWSFQEHPGLSSPRRKGTGHCPSDCGPCGAHLSGPCLAQIDLTNRCNMHCPICFANAGVTGKTFELSYAQAIWQLQQLRQLRPRPATAVQFTGGEPTVHDDFLAVVAAAREMGFSHIQIATNGLKLADLAFARRCAQAGLHTVYLQFDGVGEEAYAQTRNWPGIWEKKLAAIENCRQTGMKVCLVPTIIKGVNDGRVGEIFDFAVRNIDVVSGISYQPVSFSGRISPEQRRARRYTLADLAHDIAQASGAHPMRDMFPLSFVVPFSQFLEALTGKPKIRPSCHPDCAFGTYFLVSPEGKAYPFPRVVDMEGLFSDMNRMAAKIKPGRVGWLDKARIIAMFKRHFNAEAAPPGLTVKRFIRSLQGLVDKRLGRGQAERENYRTLLCAGMHFQDRYNYDSERLKRCVILYSTPMGIFPFCSYNCGPEYRPLVEAAYKAASGEQRPAGIEAENGEAVGASVRLTEQRP